jgi:CMP-N-acetylneuraminic acid synthetase
VRENRRIVALIPARGGSKGIPGKNIRDLAGRPLIAHTIAAALQSGSVDSVVVTTDSPEIAAVAEGYGARVPFLRPADLASDTSKSIDALVHARDWLRAAGETYDAVVLLQPTSPLRNAGDIDGAVEAYYKHGEMGVASVCEVIENPVLTRRVDAYGVLHPVLPLTSTVRRQDMPDFYHVNGAVYVNSFDGLSSETSLNDNPVAYVMPRERSVDIDSIEDFERAERLLKELEMR